jgi:hypothetical protein
MRKCHLCGSLIRRKAEFCRYCTVRQSEDVRKSHPTARSVARPPDEPDPWIALSDDSDERALRQERDQAARVAFEAQIRGATERAAARRRVFDPPPPPPPAAPPEPASEAPEPVPVAPEPVRVAPEPEPEPEVEPEPARSTATAPSAVAWSTETRTVGDLGKTDTNDQADTNGKSGANGEAGANGKANGKVKKGRHGRSNGDNGTRAPEPCAGDHLGGFEHFPEASSKPAVRWG